MECLVRKRGSSPFPICFPGFTTGWRAQLYTHVHWQRHFGLRKKSYGYGVLMSAPGLLILAGRGILLGQRDKYRVAEGSHRTRFQWALYKRQGSLDGLMFYVIPGMGSPDGARKSSIDQQFGRNSTDSTEKSKGVAPRQTSSLWNIGPTGRCFKTNPQHARPLSGANSLAASEVRFDGGPPPADLRPSQGKAEPGVVEGKVDRAGPGIYVCKTNPPRRRHRMWSRGRG